MEMIPELARVIEAARAYVHHGDDSVDYHNDLVDAVMALDARGSSAPAPLEEQDRTWGEVVAGDEILSTKTMKWYVVSNTVKVPDTGDIKLNIKGNPKPITRKPGDPVKLRRGEDGAAVDTFMILFSGQTKPTDIGTKGVGPMLEDHE